MTSRTSPDGNVSLSILNYVPTVRDAGKYMACRAENPELPDATLEDGWKLEIHCESIFSLFFSFACLVQFCSFSYLLIIDFW